jgi:hypothetical protein
MRRGGSVTPVTHASTVGAAANPTTTNNDLHNADALLTMSTSLRMAKSVSV